VADDVESIQPLQIVLRNFGFETTLAFDGREAFEEISKKNFDIVFLDICLPEMTGLEALQKVEDIQNHDRKFSKREHPLPVVTYSSYPMRELNVPEGESFFFAGHWQKPVTLADLAGLTSRMIDELGIKKGDPE
jgi:CheY-like chemotaxis protein